LVGDAMHGTENGGVEESGRHSDSCKWGENDEGAAGGAAESGRGEDARKTDQTIRWARFVSPIIALR